MPPAPSVMDPVLAALASVQEAMSGIGRRLRVLESGSVGASDALSLPSGFHRGFVPSSTAVPPARTTFPPAFSDAAYPAPSLLPPRFSAGSAVPPAPSVFPPALPAQPAFTLATSSGGVQFVSPSAAVSPQLRDSILAGKDVNLVKILISSPEEPDCRRLDCGDVSVFLKDSDPRLTKSLSFPEFSVAFGVFRDILCEAFPSRRVELDNYLAIIADLTLSYGGSLFYEYHKAFSSKAAMYLSRYNIRLDWGMVDLVLMNRLFTGRPALSCAVCGSFAHTAGLCPRAATKSSLQMNARPTGDNVSKAKVKSAVVKNPLCILFNEGVCTYANCRFLHVCSNCADAHPRSICPRRARAKKN